jgi:hypothetical protein
MKRLLVFVEAEGDESPGEAFVLLSEAKNGVGLTWLP